MKPTVKIASLLMAVLMLFSVFASGCTLSKEWSYKTSEKELAIGIYLTAMQESYNQAKNYASKLDDYDAESNKWLDMEITDDDGNTAVAREWIKNEAERKCLELLVLEPELKKLGATTDEAELDTQAKTYETQWYSSARATLEKHGVSAESYIYYMTNYSRMRDQLFEMIYGEGGTQAVSQEEITKYLTDNYGRYAALPVSLYESTTDEAGTESTVALSAEKIKSITDTLDGYAKQINEIKDPAKAEEASTKLLEEYISSNNLGESTQVTNVTLERKNPNTSVDELDKAISGLEEGKATTIKVGEDENSQSYFYIFRYNEDSLKKNYQEDGITDSTLLKKLKSKDYTAYLKSLIDKSNYEKSDSVDKYDPGIFYEETTTTAVS